MLSATCHCGAVRIEVPEAPDAVTASTTSTWKPDLLARDHYKVGTVRVSGQPENTTEYVWGEKMSRTLRGRTCGCVTHWEPLQPKPDSKLAVNARNFDPSALGSLRIRRFDGADTWTYLD